MYVNRPRPATAVTAEPAAESALTPANENVEPVRPAVRHAPRGLQPANEAGNSHQEPPTAASSTQPRPADASALNYSIDILVAPQASYAQKQAVWKQLREAGKLDQAIGDLERGMAENPRLASYPAALGQAYLQKCGTIQDVREQGILAMQADKVFDTALNLDPSNWEARFTKAVAMSYWPASLNKGQDVIEHFVTLIQQQEIQAPQPQFADTYLWLGDQYQKAGQSEEARNTWRRGAALFPDHAALKSRLTPAP
jgi:tetratricopeptide (TPR) repeat protein